MTIEQKLIDFIQDYATNLDSLLNEKSLDEVGDYLVEQGIFHSKRDIKCFLFDATPFMVSHADTNLDLPIRYYSEEEDIVPEEDGEPLYREENIIDFIQKSQSRKQK